MKRKREEGKEEGEEDSKKSLIYFTISVFDLVIYAIIFGKCSVNQIVRTLSLSNNFHIGVLRL